MSDVYLIEVEGRAVGLVARDGDGTNYRFHAAVPRVYEIDGRVFRTPDEAQRAARQILNPSARRRTEEREPQAA